MSVCFIDVELLIVFWGSEFLLRMFTVITQWPLPKGLSVTFHVRMGFKEGDSIVRSITHFEVSDVPVCLPSLKMFSWFLLIKLKT